MSTLKRTKRTLAMVAFTTLVGCGSQFTAATATQSEVITLRVYSTTSTFQLVTDISTAYEGITLTPTHIETATGNYRAMLDRLINDVSNTYLITNHLPDDIRLWSAPIAQDGIAIITYRNNPVSTLSTEQVRQIYQGLLTNWREVGGENIPISLISREEGSGIRTEFERHVMGQRRIVPTAQIVPSQIAMLTRINETNGSIGYASLSSIDSDSQIIRINGIQATQTNVLNHSYPLRSTIFIVGIREPSEQYRQLVNWIQSNEGQQTVARNYVPLPR